MRAIKEIKKLFNQVGTSKTLSENYPSTLYCLTMLQSDFLFKEAMEEILREKEAYLNKISQLRNFWIIPSSLHTMDLQPFKKVMKGSFVEKINADKLVNKVNHPFLVSLVSTDINLLRWYKLRIGSFIDIGNFIINKQNKLEFLEGSNQKQLDIVQKEEENITSTLGYFYQVSFNPLQDNFENIVFRNYPSYISKINMRDKISY